MTSQDHDPTDLDALQQRALERREYGQALAAEETADLIWLLNEARGRRVVRRLLLDAGITVNTVRSSFHQNYGQMSFNEGLRACGFKLLTKVLTLLSEGRITIDVYQRLISEEQA